MAPAGLDDNPFNPCRAMTSSGTTSPRLRAALCSAQRSGILSGAGHPDGHPGRAPVPCLVSPAPPKHETVTLRAIHLQVLIAPGRAGLLQHRAAPPTGGPAGATAPASGGIVDTAPSARRAVGSAVRRVQVGDRVIVPVTANCGQCWNCLGDRATAPPLPAAQTRLSPTWPMGRQ
jgi:hypothetical protein